MSAKPHGRRPCSPIASGKGGVGKTNVAVNVARRAGAARPPRRRARRRLRPRQRRRAARPRAGAPHRPPARRREDAAGHRDRGPRRHPDHAGQLGAAVDDRADRGSSGSMLRGARSNRSAPSSTSCSSTPRPASPTTSSRCCGWPSGSCSSPRSSRRRSSTPTPPPRCCRTMSPKTEIGIVVNACADARGGGPGLPSARRRRRAGSSSVAAATTATSPTTRRCASRCSSQRAIVDHMPQAPASRCFRILASRLAGLVRAGRRRRPPARRRPVTEVSQCA